jgi:hypothetical protein
MSAAQIESLFPGLRASGYQITSPATPSYNCFAWAGDDTRSWWQPMMLSGYYWPAEVPSELTLENLVAVYARLGYSSCDSAEPEAGFEKIAIYVDADGSPTHAARQTQAGVWTSKLGELEDVEHPAPASLESFYGKVRQVLRRPRRE